MLLGAPYCCQVSWMGCSALAFVFCYGASRCVQDETQWLCRGDSDMVVRTGAATSNCAAECGCVELLA